MQNINQDRVKNVKVKCFYMHKINQDRVKNLNKILFAEYRRGVCSRCG